MSGQTLYFIILSVLLVVVILLQQKSSALGSMMGGDAGEEIAHARRGAERILHKLTILLATLFLGSGLYVMYIASTGAPL